MDTGRLQTIIESAPDEAEAAIQGLAAQHDVAGLQWIIRESKNHPLKLRAVEALGDVESVEGDSALSGLVEDLQVAVMGGTEQKIEHDELQRAAASSLSRRRGG